MRVQTNQKQINLKNMNDTMLQCANSKELKKAWNTFKNLYEYGFIDRELWRNFFEIWHDSL